DVRLQRQPVVQEQRRELDRGVVQPADGPLEGGAVRGERRGHRVVVTDQLAERLLPARERLGELVQLDDQRREVVALRGQRREHAGGVLDQSIEVRAIPLQHRRGIRDEGGDDRRVDTTEVVLERAEQLVRLGRDGGPAERDGG